MSAQKYTRKLNEPVRDATHASTAPVKRDGSQKVKGNPTSGGRIFGHRRATRKTLSA